MLTIEQNKAIRQLKGWQFQLYLISQLPMGFLAGLGVESLDENISQTSVPFNFITKNPFKSMYFAVQSMAAELSTALPCLLAITGKKPSVAFIIVSNKASFYKKATSKVYFTCDNVARALVAVETCISENRPTEVTFKTLGKMKDGTIVSEFEFTWSFKQRSKAQ